VTLFDFDELLVCRYDLQVGLWPNLFKTRQCIILSSVNYFPSIFQIKPIFFMFSSPQTLKLYSLWKEYLFSKYKFIKIGNKVHPYMSTYFTLKVVLQLFLLFSK
jgi:hypothetical protein